MNKQEIKGLWRYEQENVKIDFFAFRNDKDQSLFTVIVDGIISYEWSGKISFKKNEINMTIFNIAFEYKSHANSIYENIKVFYSSDNNIILEFKDGSRAEFKRIIN